MRTKTKKELENKILKSSSLVDTSKELTCVLDIERLPDNADKFDFIGNISGLWIVEHEYFFIGGPIKWDQNLFLKDYDSGYYLSIELQDDGKHYFSMIKNVSEKCLWQLKNVEPENKDVFVGKNAIFLLKNVHTGKFIGMNLKDLVFNSNYSS